MSPGALRPNAEREAGAGPRSPGAAAREIAEATLQFGITLKLESCRHE